MGKIAAAKACMYRLTKSNISSRTGRQISIFIYNPARRRRFILTNRIGPGTQAPSHLLQENRKSRYAFFSIIIYAVACPSAFAQTIEQTDLAYVIVAGKNSFEQEYKTGSRFLIKFKSGSSIQKTRVFLPVQRKEK